MRFGHAVLALAITMGGWGMQARAEVATESLEYKDGETVCEGYLAYPKDAKGKLPAVVIVHDWMGVSAETKRRAEMLAELGYVALCADVYGKGVRPKDGKEAGGEAGKYRKDRALLMSRLKAAFDELAKNEKADAKKLAAMGYCFGGTCVLEMARDGFDLRGVVSFHGGLAATKLAEAATLKAKILVLHGADDPHVPSEQVLAFEKEMRDAKADWALVAYGNAVHAFTNPGAGSDNSKGAAYNEKADKRSWDAMKNFFAEIFKD